MPEWSRELQRFLLAERMLLLEECGLKRRRLPRDGLGLYDPGWPFYG